LPFSSNFGLLSNQLGSKVIQSCMDEKKATLQQQIIPSKRLWHEFIFE